MRRCDITFLVAGIVKMSAIEMTKVFPISSERTSLIFNNGVGLEWGGWGVYNVDGNGAALVHSPIPSTPTQHNPVALRSRIALGFLFLFRAGSNNIYPTPKRYYYSHYTYNTERFSFSNFYFRENRKIWENRLRKV